MNISNKSILILLLLHLLLCQMPQIIVIILKITINCIFIFYIMLVNVESLKGQSLLRDLKDTCNDIVAVCIILFLFKVNIHHFIEIR